MARRKQATIDTQVADYRYAATRKNNPPAGLAAQGVMEGPPKVGYAYNPHLPPCLRFDDTGRADKLPELLVIARQRPLSEAEARLLADALRIHEPWLEWAGKREKKGFAVDPVVLHIHERISTQAILKIAAREDITDMLPGLFAKPALPYHQAVQFYQHDVDRSNRMILGDSLQVMTSLAHRENLAGKVQMIYMDPPYGIRFGSNFQPEVGQRDVKDREQDLTCEPEMVKAYRDTWTLGVHSHCQLLQKFERRKFDTGGAIRPRPIEAVHEIPVGILFQPLKRQGASGGIANQALQLIPPMRRNRRVGVQGKAVDTGTARAFEFRTLPCIAKA
jgi:adenine-specific DNA-methyltransferase